MALIHEQLYRSGDLTRIDFRDYVDGLTRNVLASAGEVGRPVKLTLDVEPVSLDLDVGIACGLILNELLSNAMKHAFPDGERDTSRSRSTARTATPRSSSPTTASGFPRSRGCQEQPDRSGFAWSPP